MFDSSQKLNPSLFLSDNSSGQWVFGLFFAAKKSNGLHTGSCLNFISRLEFYCFLASCERIVRSPRLVGA